MKLISWNVNGIRAAHRGGFLNWFEEQKADIVCLQEIKAFSNQLEPQLVHPGKYHSYFHSAKKPGYSGVVLYSKREPLDIQFGIGVQDIDQEGRVIVAEYPDFVLINTYFPNSQREHTRLEFKIYFCNKIFEYCNNLRIRKKNFIICGDFNIAHREIDLKNPKSNANNAGFLPEERAWMESFLNQGYIDTFRHFNSDPGHYTWWSYRPGVREKNIGWRIDYFVTNQELKDQLRKSSHQTLVKGSDHCPIVLELKT